MSVTTVDVELGQLAALLGVAVGEPGSAADLADELHLDSIQRLELAAWLADRGVDVETLPVGEPRTVGDLLALVRAVPAATATVAASVTAKAKAKAKAKANGQSGRRQPRAGGRKAPRRTKLHDGRFTLRPVTPEYVPFLYGLAISEEIGFRWRYRGAVPTQEAFQSGLHQGVLSQFVVTLSASGEPVGLVVVYNADLSRGIGYLAAVFTPEYVLSGLGVGAVDLFVRYVFQVWNLRKLYMEMPEYNFEQIASGAGRNFDVEGRLRDFNFYDGRYWDEYLLAVCRHHVGAPPAAGFPPPPPEAPEPPEVPEVPEASEA